MTIGIYRLYNKVTGKSYVGKSKNIEKRMIQHRTCIKRKKIVASSAYEYMHEDYKKYGMESFDYEVLEECLLDELDTREQHWMQKFDVFNIEKGYNIDAVYRGKSDFNFEVDENLSKDEWWKEMANQFFNQK
jgi:group I intron endonuclease